MNFVSGLTQLPVPRYGRVHGAAIEAPHARMLYTSTNDRYRRGAALR